MTGQSTVDGMSERGMPVLLGGERADTPCRWCDCLLSRCDAIRPGRKCCPDCRHPRRVQRRRTKGSRLPTGVLCITRPSRFGNPFRVVGSTVVGMNWDDVVEWGHGVGAMPSQSMLYAELTDRRGAVNEAVELYRELLAVRRRQWEPTRYSKWLLDARGRDVACYCPVSEPCHGDPLLEAVNALDIAVEARRRCNGCGRVFSTHGLRSHQSGRSASADCRARPASPA